jgi:23S rRNA pseudouridine1911/1915/1917 synthase
VAARHISVGAADAGKRLDQVVRQLLPGLSRAALADAIASGLVRVNGRRASKGVLVQLGDVLQLELLEPSVGGGPAADPTLTLPVLYEDAFLVVVDKPAGVPSAALRTGERGTVASALLAHYPEMAGVGYRPLEPGLLHRLDTHTSGVLLAARDVDTFAALRLAHEHGEIGKSYVALCVGRVQAPQTVRGFLRADQRRVRVQSEPLTGARAVQLELVSSAPHGAWSLVEVHVPFAARHQVRAQLSAIGHPIAGDTLYGGPSLPELNRHFLHAAELRLRHPKTDQPLQVRAPLPAELQRALTHASRHPP